MDLVLAASVKPKAGLSDQCWILSPLLDDVRRTVLLCLDEQCLVNAALGCCTLHKVAVDVILLVQRQHRVPVQGGNPFKVLFTALRDTHTAPGIPTQLVTRNPHLPNCSCHAYINTLSRHSLSHPAACYSVPATSSGSAATLASYSATLQ